MEPSRYSVLIVDRSSSERTYHQASQYPDSEDSTSLSLPFLAACGDGCICESDKQNIDDLVKIFLSIFSEVTTVPSGRKALSFLKERTLGCPPTILLIDIDHTEGVSRDLYARKNSFIVPDSRHSINLQEFTTSRDTLYGLEFLNYVTKEISKGMLEQVIPIVCSWRDSFDIILDCINKGALDYLIKPIRPEVAKTLFLNAHRFAISGNKSPIPQVTMDYRKPAIRRSCSFEQRLEEFFVKDKWLAKALIEYYTPPESTVNIPFTPKLSQASELERRNVLKNKLSEWDFNPHQLNDDELLKCVIIIFDHVMSLDELKEISVSTEQLHQLLFAIRQSYYDTNPYHNFTHAVDVLQAMFLFLCKMGLIPPLFSSKRQSINVNKQRCRPNDLLTPVDAFALLLASIGHDVGHPGVSNTFLVQSQTPLAQVYNDISVLENFHVMTLFNLMQKYGFKIYKNDNGSVYNPKYNEFRKVIVSAILATDMELHNNYVCKIKEETKKFDSLGTKFIADSNLEPSRNTIIGALIKCADISNVARPYHIAASWSNVLLEEFKCQGDLERKLGLPIGPINDRYGKTTQSESQIGFIDFVALPLFKCAGDLIHELKFCVPYLEQNKKQWQERKENQNEDTHSLNHKNSVSYDCRKNSPIAIVPAAKTIQHQPSGTYLRQIPNLPDGTEMDDWYKSNEVLSTTGASDSPLNSRHDTQKNSSWPIFSRNNRSLSNMVYASTYTSTDNVSNQNHVNDNVTICCCIQ
ncbi:HD-domain/PDEase-like protein [Gigaspora margarita]|uniref:Phosphodiesterase n=2 Tax=Gigaspora margarita TaxID=4874 RepID=A0A8H3XI64_GIGMA|nr:HD-domain/PDEase-like protein [Gigaspora margarita]